MNVVRDVGLQALLAELHARSDQQVALMKDIATDPARPPTEEEIKVFLSDKLVPRSR